MEFKTALPEAEDHLRQSYDSPLTDSGWRICKDAEPRVSADPRGRQVPGGKLGPYPRLSAGNLFPPVAAPGLLLPDVTGGAPTPVSLLLLPLQALWFGRAGSSCCCGGRGAGGGATGRLRVRVRAEAVEVDQLGLLLVGQLQLPQRLLRTVIWICSRTLRGLLLVRGGGAEEQNCAGFGRGG